MLDIHTNACAKIERMVLEREEDFEALKKEIFGELEAV